MKNLKKRNFYIFIALNNRKEGKRSISLIILKEIAMCIPSIQHRCFMKLKKAMFFYYLQEFNKIINHININ